MIGCYFNASTTFVLALKNAFMKIIRFVLVLAALAFQKVNAQNPVNWTAEQLIQPSELAATLKEGKEIPVIISVGPSALIPHSKDIGIIKEKENMKKFKDMLAGLSKDTRIVVYCGCCPYEHCPNVRPAVEVLKEMKFTNFKLLDLPHNIKMDWINMGYPTEHK